MIPQHPERNHQAMADSHTVPGVLGFLKSLIDTRRKIASAGELHQQKNISVWAEWLHHSGRAPSEPSETPRWQITPHPVSIPPVALHIALQSLFHRFFSLCRFPILNDHSGVGANCDHTSEWIHWVHACIWIAMRWVTLRKSLLTFLLPVRKMQFSLYSLYTSFQVARSMWLLTIHHSFRPSPVLLLVAISGIS